MTNSPSTRSLTLAHALYGLIFLVALFLRLFRLGIPPLNDNEAYWALQALDLAHGNFSLTSAQPGYTVLTGFLLFLVDDSNFWVRLLPALAGSFLVWLPVVIRPALPDTQLFRRAGILFAIALAIDPALVALSRQAGSLMTGLGFVLLALAFWLSGKRVWAGILAGVAVLSGPGMLHGILGLILALVIAGAFSVVVARSEATKQSPETPRHAEHSEASPPFTNPFFLSFLLTVLFLGSGFFLYPRGLAGLAETIGDYLQAWIPGSASILGSSTASSLAALPLAILLYQPLALLLGLISGVRSWLISLEDEQAPLGRFLGLWVLTSFLLTFLNPHRQVVDLAWTLVPLWALAALELSRYTLPEGWEGQRWVFQGASFLFAFFLILGGYYLIYLNTMGVDLPLQAAMLAGIGAMALIVALLFAAGWSLDITKIGLVWGISAVLTLWMFSPTWGMSQLRPNGAVELWRTGSAAGPVNDLTSTLKDLAAWDTSIDSLLEIQSTVESPSLRWALRDFSPVTFTSSLAKDQLPAVFITPESTQSPELLASYRGQDFDWEVTPGWTGPLPPDLLRWLYLRRAPVTYQKIILWVRADIFPGGELKP